ncbi:hypothetical protein M0R45_034050 [Rubus argutus]|uniref:Uncharacterized protein n=1 Tax=Rubus argutus TaxID=59490 RepID=A0AAW1VUK1_RUBAR
MSAQLNGLDVLVSCSRTRLQRWKRHDAGSTAVRRGCGGDLGADRRRRRGRGEEDGEAVDFPISRTERKKAGDMDGMQLEKHQGVDEKRWAADGGCRLRW